MHMWTFQDDCGHTPYKVISAFSAKMLVGLLQLYLLPYDQLFVCVCVVGEGVSMHMLEQQIISADTVTQNFKYTLLVTLNHYTIPACMIGSVE